jgi:hypothetical protein
VIGEPMAKKRTGAGAVLRSLQAVEKRALQKWDSETAWLSSNSIPLSLRVSLEPLCRPRFV